MMNLMRAALTLLALYTIPLPRIEALRFFLSPGKSKCLKEEIHKGMLVNGEYALSESLGATATVTVTDTKGHKLYNREDFDDTNGKFTFISDDDDAFEICVIAHPPPGQEQMASQLPQRVVFIDVKHGVETKNYDDLAKVEKLKPLEVELRRLEDLSESIVDDFKYMHKRDEEMRSTNESTNSRAMWLTIFSLCSLLSLTTWQVFYLRRYFKSKKIID